MATSDDMPLPFPPHALEIVALRSLDDIGGYCSCVKDSPRYDRYSALKDRGWVRSTWVEGIRAFQFSLTPDGRAAMATPDDQVRM